VSAGSGDPVPGPALRGFREAFGDE
jgi:hypothetical protein